MTMYPFDHIRHRNWDKRLALHNKASELLAEAEKQNELALDIEDDDEWEARNDEIDNTIMKRFSGNPQDRVCFVLSRKP